MFDPHAFWGADPYQHPPLTEAMVEELERALGLRLPPRHVELLRLRNGGYTRGFVFPTARPTSWAGDHVPLDGLAGIGRRHGLPAGLFNLWNSEYVAREWGLPPRQLLLTGDGHWWISLDYRGGGEPQVLWLDTEVGQLVRLAPTFDAFLEGLRPEPAVAPARALQRRPAPALAPA